MVNHGEEWWIMVCDIWLMIINGWYHELKKMEDYRTQGPFLDSQIMRITRISHGCFSDFQRSLLTLSTSRRCWGMFSPTLISTWQVIQIGARDGNTGLRESNAMTTKWTDPKHVETHICTKVRIQLQCFSRDLLIAFFSKGCAQEKSESVNILFFGSAKVLLSMAMKQLEHERMKAIQVIWVKLAIYYLETMKAINRKN